MDAKRLLYHFPRMTAQMILLADHIFREKGKETKQLMLYWRVFIRCDTRCPPLFSFVIV